MKKSLYSIFSNAREIQKIVGEPYIYMLTKSPEIEHTELTRDDEFRVLDLGCKVVDEVKMLLERGN